METFKAIVMLHSNQVIIGHFGAQLDPEANRVYLRDKLVYNQV